MYKAKWQQLLSQHTSVQSTVERLQRDLQQLQESHADLQQVNRALESRLLGHSPTTAATSPGRGKWAGPTSPGRQPQGNAGSSPARQPYRGAADRQGYYNPAGAAGNQPCPEHLTSGRTATDQRGGWNSTSNLDRVLAEHKGRVSPGHGQAFEHSEMTLSTEEADSETQPPLDNCVSSEDIMARLTRSPPSTRGATGAIRFIMLI